MNAEPAWQLPSGERLPERAAVVVVGAGLAGLAAARALHRTGQEVLVVEAADGVGGRVRSDLVEGFRLDRGFQVLLTEYPEAERQLDLAALRLRAFDPGALVRTAGRFSKVGDPLRRPSTALSSLSAPVGSAGDKLRLARLLLQLRRADPVELLRGEDRATSEALRELGFSDRMVQSFFRPLVGGIQLDPDMTASSRMFKVILLCLARGQAAVPAAGMGAIPAQLASGLPDRCVALGTPAVEVTAGSVTVGSGQQVLAERVVVATEGPVAAELLGLPHVESKPVSCVWYVATKAPYEAKLIALDGLAEGPALNVSVITNVAPEYSPDGHALIAVACPGLWGDDLELRARSQMRSWFGSQVNQWRALRIDTIAHGQPDQRPPFNPKQRVALGEGLFVCGDHRDTASIQGALFSGRRCGEAVAASLQV